GEHAGRLAERADRRVHEQDVGFESERARERGALAHAAGELPGIVLREVLEPDRLERALRARLALGPGHALEHHAEVDVLEHGVPREQRVLLEHEGDVAWHRPGDPLARDFHRAGRGRHQPADDVEQGRLAAAARPDQAEELAARDVERGVAQRAHVAGVALFAELMRDAPDPDRDLIGTHEYGPGSRSRLAGGRLGLLPLPTELGFTRVRHLKWPKSDKSDFGWERESTELAARVVSQ